ncbi:MULTISPECIES: universal stress protein [Shewanella]|uniref:Universal stress protein UspA n=1 Tax=Shewanella polaris TaxID=2588449 RepID=A0A4Y5YCS3_9GAMM|nr:MULTISPECIES: universal stress protein [Shewanella]QDE30590.1 universal stress protein UspA [Shewanella polaris]
MNKVFIIAQMEQAHTDAVAIGLTLTKQMNKRAEVFAYIYAYLGAEDTDQPRLAGLVQKTLMEQREYQLLAQLDSLDAKDVPLHLIWSKYLFEHACHHSARHSFDLMIKAVHHADHYLPTDWQLIRHTKIPLLLLTNNPLNKGGTTLISIDLDTKNSTKQRLNDAVIVHGKQLAEATGTQLHAAYVLRIPQIIRDMDLLDINALVKKAYADHKQQIADIGIDSDCMHIISGEPDLCLFELACRLNSEYFVIGARQRQGLLGRIIGNTAEAILGRMRSNVLVIPAEE